MKSSTKERIFWWIAIPALAGVLVVLAVMQYRWSGQVSDAARTQMESSVHLALAGFRMDFTREVSAAAVEVRSAVRDSGDDRQQFNERLLRWQQSAAHPALVSSVYLWQSGKADQLVRLYPAGDRAESAGWPEGFSRLRQRILETSPQVADARRQGARWLGAARGRRSLGMPRMNRGGRRNGRAMESVLPWYVDQSIPALISPVRAPDASPGNPGQTSIALVIIGLNPVVFEKEIFPELAQRYFSGNSGLDYHVAVADGSKQPERVLFASTTSFSGAADQAADAAADLFGPMFRNGPPVPAFGQDFMNHHAGTPSAQRHNGQQARAPQPPGQSQGQSDDRHDHGMDRVVRLEPLRYSPDEGTWHVLVKHPSGSVATAVGELRRRNLMLSFGVLILLAVTMAIMVVASQRARRLARLQMDFVAGVSHELRTPLAVISSAAENIADGIVADKEQLARYGKSIVKQTRQLTQLVDQVLVFAATQQQPQRYPLRPVDVGEVIAAAIENTASVIKAAGVTVERNIEPGLPLASADFAALSQCLQNLITNAVKYGGDDHWIGVHAAARTEGGSLRDIEITVADHGIGIGEQEMKHIFKPFYRSPSVAGSNIHGTGLGLPLAKTVIEAMRGSLTVQSEPGKGSAFIIRLAVAEGLREPREKMSGSVSSATAGETS
jgi:two-component system, OmpR family, sensor histidine kinase SenX3